MWGLGRISPFASSIGKVVHPSAKLAFDTSKPDGSPRKLLDVSALHGLGWRHGVELEEGVRTTYEWFLEDLKAHRVNAGES